MLVFYKGKGQSRSHMELSTLHFHILSLISLDEVQSNNKKMIIDFYDSSKKLFAREIKSMLENDLASKFDIREKNIKELDSINYLGEIAVVVHFDLTGRWEAQNGDGKLHVLRKLYKNVIFILANTWPDENNPPMDTNENVDLIIQVKVMSEFFDNEKQEVKLKKNNTQNTESMKKLYLYLGLTFS